MKPKARLLVLTFLLLVAPSESLAAPQTGLFWCESSPGDNGDAFPLEKSINLKLCQRAFPDGSQDPDSMGGPVKPNRMTAWIKSPDGAVSKADVIRKKETVALNFPRGLHTAKLDGLYAIGAHVVVEGAGIDSNDHHSKVHYYPKYLIISHQNEECIQTAEPCAFFNDPDRIALEIGPVYTEDDKKGMNWKGLECQEALREQRLKVLYHGEALANADVTVFTEGGWQRTVTTDGNGEVKVVPLQGTGDHETIERCLYTASIRDAMTGEYQCSSLMMCVRPHRPLYDSKARGFSLWVIVGATLFLFCIAFLINRKRGRVNTNRAQFEGYKIGRE